jgi:hypothetical protein
MELNLREIFDNWDKVPVEVKKEITRRRKEASDRMQGTIIIKDPEALGMA